MLIFFLLLIEYATMFYFNLKEHVHVPFLSNCFFNILKVVSEGECP